MTLLIALTTPSNTVLAVRDGRAWILAGSRWSELREAHVTSLGAHGIGGSVLTASQRDALLARVGAP